MSTRTMLKVSTVVKNDLRIYLPKVNLHYWMAGSKVQTQQGVAKIMPVDDETGFAYPACPLDDY